MNAPSPEFASSASRTCTLADASPVAMRWKALMEAGEVVAMLAGVETERPTGAIRNFPAMIRDREPWRQDLAENGCADLAAMMEPGISALLAINARGADCKPAAQALWREFAAGRAALLALLPPVRETG